MSTIAINLTLNSQLILSWLWLISGTAMVLFAFGSIINVFIGLLRDRDTFAFYLIPASQAFAIACFGLSLYGLFAIGLQNAAILVFKIFTISHVIIAMLTLLLTFKYKAGPLKVLSVIGCLVLSGFVAYLSFTFGPSNPFFRIDKTKLSDAIGLSIPDILIYI